MNESSITSQTLGDNADLFVDEINKSIAPDVRPAPANSIASRFENYLDHPVFLNHLTWSNTTAYSLVTKDLVAYYYANMPTTMANKLANFMYFRAKIKIQIVVQGNPAAGGQMTYAFTPRVYTPMYGTVTHVPVSAQTVNMKIVPHIEIDPSKTATYELILPMVSPTGWYSFSSAYNHGSYMFEQMPYAPITSGTATACTADICTYVSFVEPEFQGMTVLLSSPFESEKKLGGSYSALAKSISSTAMQAAKTFPVVAPTLTLFSSVTGALGSVLSWFGFSKPPAIENQVFVTNRNCDNYSQCDGKSTSIVLGSSQTQSLGISPSYQWNS